MHLTANIPRNLSVKTIFKSVKIWQNYGDESVAHFLAHPIYWHPQFHRKSPLALKQTSFITCGVNGA